EEGDCEIDHETGHVDEGGDEGSGGGGWVEAQSFEQEGQHRTGQGSPDDDPDEGGAHGQTDQQPVRAVGRGHGGPGGDPCESDGTEDGSQQDPGQDLAAHHAPPVAQLDLAQRQGADDQGGRLRARVAAAGDDQGDEQRQDDRAGDLTLEE